MVIISKKADASLALVIIIIVVLFLAWLVNIGSRECYNNKDCAPGSYCGSDFSCHEMQSIIIKNNYILPSIIIGIAIILAALIIKWKDISNIIKKKPKEPNSEQKVYYSHNF